MNQSLCYLLCILFYDLFLLDADEFYILDFIIPIYAFLLLQKDKKRSVIWLFGLNLFVVFVAISYLLNEQISSAVNLMIRTNLILLLAISLFLGKDQYFITKALYSLKLPQKLIAIMMINSKLFKEILFDISKMSKTLKARGVDIKVSIFTYRAYANLIGKIVVNSLDKSFLIFKTMRVRGYNGSVGFLNLKKATFVENLLFFAILIDICFRIYITYE